jgi:hypothetical protein
MFTCAKILKLYINTENVLYLLNNYTYLAESLMIDDRGLMFALKCQNQKTANAIWQNLAKGHNWISQWLMFIG